MQVGALRVVLSLEDLGPATPRPAASHAGSPTKPGRQVGGPAEVRKLSPAERDRATALARQEATHRTQRAAAAAAQPSPPELTVDRALQLVPGQAPAPARILETAAVTAAGPGPAPATEVASTSGATARAVAVPAAMAPAAAQPGWVSSPPPPPLSQALPASMLLAPSRREVEAAVAAEVEKVRAKAEVEARESFAAWRRAEELSFKARCREVEADRLQVLEGEFRRRERAREGEVTALRHEYAALEAKLREVLGAAEEREAKVIATEESLARRRKAMEHEHALRLQEAEAAVRRLQAEFEHQLVLERERTAESVRQRQEAERRLQEAQVRYEGLHQAFEAHREKARSAPEGRAQAELALAIEARHRAEARAERLGRAKKQYKEQVLRLAREVAGLQRQRLAEAEQFMARERRHVDALTWINAAGQAAGSAHAERDELQDLKLQLRKLATAAAGADAGIVPAAAAPLHESESAEVRSELAAELRRLLQERAELLETGVYAEADPIIAELGRQIGAVRESLSLGGAAGIVNIGEAA